MFRSTLAAASLAVSFATANYFGSPEMAGNSQNLLGWGSPATGTPTIAPSQYRPGQGPGKMIGPVNGFNGQPAYSVALGGVSARGAVSFPITLSYSGPTRALFEGDHARAPVGWIGMGWNFEVPYIAVNHKGTYSSTDDVIFASLGPFGGGQLLQNPTTSKFYLATNPYIKITTTSGTGDYTGQFINWTFQFPDGKKLVFGNGGNSQRTVNYHKHVIKAVPFSGVTTRKFIYRWDISSLADYNGTNTILFDYDPKTEDVGHGRTYVRESHVKNIRWNGIDGVEAERYEFLTAAKSNLEYLAYASNEAKDDQRPFDTLYLDRINCYKEGVLSHHYKLNHQVVSGGSIVSGGTGDCLKRLLTSIDVVRYDNGGNPVNDRGWQFTHHNISKFFLLSKATTPDGASQTFAYKEVNFAGKEGDQSLTPGFMKKPDHNTFVGLPPGDNVALAKWRNESKCDDRFCYVLAKTAWNENAKMYVEIRPNRGNYFDTISNNPVKRFESVSTSTEGLYLDLIPAGDYFLWVDSKYGTVDLWEWDDGTMIQRFPFLSDPRYSTGNFRHIIKVYPGGDYFVIHKTDARTSGTAAATPNEIIVVKRMADGTWKSFNKDPSACNFDNKGDYGQPIRASRTSGACMELNTSDILVSTAPTYFAVVHKPVDAITLYGNNSHPVDGFINQTSKLPVAGSSQLTGYPMNWEVNIGQLAAERDYFVLYTYNATHAINTFYYSGDLVYNAGYLGSLGNTRTVYTSQNYFIEKSSDNLFRYWEKRWDGTNLLFVRGASDISTTRPTNYATRVPLVRTHPKAFTIEYYDHADSIGSRPCVVGTNYATNLFAVHRAHSIGYANRTPYFNGENVFNMSFSGADDQMFALTGENSSSSPCGVNQACTFKHVTIRTHPNNHTDYFFPTTDVFAITPNQVPAYRQSQIVMSGSRIAMRTTLDWGMLRVRWEPFQWGGANYGTPTKHFVVDSVISSAGLGGASKDNIIFNYVYDRQPYWRVEFNSNLQTPQFEVCEVKQVNFQAANLGGNLAVFHTDVLAKPLTYATLFLNGTEKSTTTFGTASADTLIKSDQVMASYRNTTNWPSDLFVNRVYKTTLKHVSSNRAWRSSTVSFHRYNDNNGAPHYMVSALGTGPHEISQTLFDPLDLPFQNIRFRSATYPDTNLLRTSNPSTLLNSVTGFTSLSPVSSSRSYNTSNFLPLRQEAWRDYDDAMTEANMKLGTTPVFNLAEGWISIGEITKRNIYNQTTETKVPKSSTSGDEIYSSSFYEGRMSLPVASVTNSKLDNCAVLLGENFAFNFPGLDYPNPVVGRWEQWGVTFNPYQSHTGRSSLRVDDNYGTVINLYLKDVRSKNLTMTFSAWIYAENGTTPVFTAQPHNASGGGGYPTFSAVPAGNGWADAQNRWQRWTLTLTNAQLIQGVLFNGSNDYIRVRIGTGAPASSSRRVFIDDIVIIPGDASFSASTHDYRGVTTSKTGSDHLPVHFDLDVRGGVMATRDHRKRIFSQGAFHFMGEN